MIATEDNIASILTCLEAADEIGVDTETTGFEVRYGTDYLMGFCVSVDGLDSYIPFRHKANNLSKRYLPDLFNIFCKKPLIWHNRKFDMHSVKTIGMDPLYFKGPQYDTMMIAHLVDEEMWSKELDFLAKKFLNEGKKNSEEVHKLGEIYGWKNLPVEVVAPYGEKDANITRRLKNVLWPLLVNQELESVYWETEAPFTNLLYLLEQRGVGTDLQFAERKATVGRGRMATLQRELGFNPASPLDLRDNLLTKLDLPVFQHTSSCEACKAGFDVNTHEGKPSFNKIAMKEYDDILMVMNDPTARKISEYRGWQKAVTSLYEPVLERTGPDGFIRTSFKQHGTVTGRLSASEPNLQQVPRHSPKIWNGDAKRCFTSGRDGYLLYGWDYSQLELRLAAAYGNEKILLDEFAKDKADPFNVLAPIIFGILTEETRHETKTFTYANLYGAGLSKIARQLGRTVEETRPLYERYKASISGIINVSGQVSKLVEQRGYVKYWDGRRRHIKNRSDSYKAWNSVCQGGGAQLVKQAMLRCLEFEDENLQMVLQVHDEITFTIAEHLIPKYEPMIKEAMTDFPVFPVRLAVEGKEWK